MQELAIELLTTQPALPPRDALHAAVLQRHGLDHVISADRHFDVIAGITRLDPAAWQP